MIYLPVCLVHTHGAPISKEHQHSLQLHPAQAKVPAFWGLVTGGASYPARAGQVLLGQVHFGQDEYGPLAMGVHLADQVCDDAALRVHTAIWR